MTQPPTLSHKTDELPSENNGIINEGTSTNFKDHKLHKTDKGTKLNNGKTSSSLVDKVSNQSKKRTVCSSENKIISC